MSFPKSKLLLDYSLVFGTKPPRNRLSLLGNLSRHFLLLELCGLNYKLKPKDEIYFNNKHKLQVELLNYYTVYHKPTFEKYASVAEYYSNENNDDPLIFNRPACIFSIEEILNADNLNEELPPEKGYSVFEWEGLLKYLLAVNYEITQIKKIDEANLSFETFNSAILTLNESIIESHPVFTPYRGFQLVQHLLKNPLYSSYIKEYFKETYKVEHDCLIYHIIGINAVKKTENPDHEFIFNVLDDIKPLFEALSKRTKNNDISKLLNIKKSPFIKDIYGSYILADLTFLVEKSYTLFINDFWFDKIKNVTDENGKNIFDIKNYRGEIGYFIEEYLSIILKSIFTEEKNYILFLFDELKVKTNKGFIELADVYLRDLNNILIGQLKSGNIYDKEKFGGDTDSLYKGNRNKFFEDFGVNQIVSSILNIDRHIKKLDKDYPERNSIIIYPCIITHEKVFQTTFMAQIFNLRFQELLSTNNLKHIKIKPLLLIPISAFEELESTLFTNPSKIWDILEQNCIDTSFIPPFHYKIDNVNSIEKYPTRLRSFFHKLIQKYHKEK